MMEVVVERREAGSKDWALCLAFPNGSQAGGREGGGETRAGREVTCSQIRTAIGTLVRGRRR